MIGVCRDPGGEHSRAGGGVGNAADDRAAQADVSCVGPARPRCLAEESSVLCTDGIVRNRARLRELVPWKEARNDWEELLDGDYEWSSSGQASAGEVSWDGV